MGWRPARLGFRTGYRPGETESRSHDGETLGLRAAHSYSRNVRIRPGVAVLLASLVPPAASAQLPTDPSELYEVACAVCHGTDGTGQIDNPAIETERMDFSDCAVTTPEPDADWQLVIGQGGPAAGLSGDMPAYADSLTRDQIDGLIGHVRSFCTEEGWPLGNLNFPRPIFTEKAFPENEIVILPEVTRATNEETRVGLRAVFERRVGRRGHVEVRLPLESVSEQGSRHSGLGDIKMAGKYVLHTDETATRITTAGFEVSLPTGDVDSSLGKGTTVLEPYVAFGTRARDVYIQTQLKVEVPTDEPGDTELGYNVYLGTDLSELLSTWTVGVELNGIDDRLALTPQIGKGLTRTGALAAAFGVQVPLNKRDDRQIRWVGYLLWEFLDPVRAVRD